MIELAAPQLAKKFLHQLHRPVVFFVVRHWREEVPWVGQAVAADRPQVGQAQWRAVVLGDITASLRVEQFDAELEATRQHGDLQRRDLHHTEFSGDAQAPEFGHQQQLAIGIEEHPLHRAIGPVAVDAHACRFVLAGVGRHGDPTIDEIGGLGGNGQGAPAQAIGRHRAQRATGQLPLQANEGRMQRRRTNAVHPGTARFTTSHGEGGTGKQLGIEAVRRFLRGVLPNRQGAGERFTAEFITEATQVFEDRRGGIEVHRASWPGGPVGGG
ncbi:hypothetical protein D9M71_370250 [compost metagenome]